MKSTEGFAALLAALALGACAHGQYGGLDHDPKRWGIVFCTNDPAYACSAKQRELVETLLTDAAKLVDREMSGVGEAAASGGGVSSFATVVATVVTVANPFAGAALWIVAVDSAAQGAASALGSFSYARVSAAIDVANILKEDRMKMKVPGYEDAESIRIVHAFNRATTGMEEFQKGKMPSQ